MNQAYYWCYPWDLEDEGTDTALGRMAGEIGVDAVSVAAILPALTAFRARAVKGPRTIHREAAAHFQPSAECYSNTRLRPAAAAWMKSRNPMERITQACGAHGLKPRAWAVCCENRTLAARHPMAACVDVFGDPIPGRLCPSNADVREYVAALAADLTTHYPLDALELEAADFGGPSDQFQYKIGVDIGPIGRGLANWCFCPACWQRAEDVDIDVASVQRNILAILEPLLRLEPTRHTTFGDVLSEYAELAAYHRMRCESVRSLIKSVRRRTEARLLLHIPTNVWVSGADVATLGAHCDGFIASPGRGDAHASPLARAESLARACEAVERVEVGLSCYPPLCRDGPALVMAVHQASQQGYGAIGFSNYGLTPQPCLDWVRQAIRYARRESRA
ncbi:MAG: hypothetical protein ACE5EC_03745 [Phycisphaerae bacterium]